MGEKSYCNCCLTLYKISKIFVLIYGEQYKSMNKFIALIGAGYWGKNLLRNLYELEVLHTACEVNKEIIDERKKKFFDVYYTTSYQEVLANDQIKAVVIATPAATHFEKVKQALLADKDVFVEKPLALKVEEGEKLVKLARERNRILMVGHNFTVSSSSN